MVHTYHGDDVTLYKAQVVYSLIFQHIHLYIPPWGYALYHTSDKTEAMQFTKYSSKYYCNRNRSHTIPQGQSLQISKYSTEQEI